MVPFTHGDRESARGWWKEEILGFGFSQKKTKTKSFLFRKQTRELFVSSSSNLGMGVKIPHHLGTACDALDAVTSIGFNAQRFP